MLWDQRGGPLTDSHINTLWWLFFFFGCSISEIIIYDGQWAAQMDIGDPRFLYRKHENKRKRSVVARTILHIPNQCIMDKWVAARCVYLGLATFAECEQSVYSGSYIGLYSAEHLDKMPSGDQYLLDQGCLRHSSTALTMRQQYTSPRERSLLIRSRMWGYENRNQTSMG